MPEDSHPAVRGKRRRFTPPTGKSIGGSQLRSLHTEYQRKETAYRNCQFLLHVSSGQEGVPRLTQGKPGVANTESDLSLRNGLQCFFLEHFFTVDVASLLHVRQSKQFY